MKLSDVGVWSLEFITPEIAADYLARNGPNRSVKVGRVNEYARSMSSGAWKLTHQGVAFDMRGKLTDGQHRLHGIVKSLVGQWVMVFRWKIETDISALDDGKARSLRDAATITGLDASTTHCAVVNLIARITCAITAGGSAGRLTRSEAINEIKVHSDAIEWADGHLGHEKGIGCGLMKTVVVMAWYTADRERLAEMCQILKSGVCTSEGDMAAIKIRDFLLNGRNVGGGSSDRFSAFKKLQGAVKAFLEHRPITRMCESEGILFPIPERS